MRLLLGFIAAVCASGCTSLLTHGTARPLGKGEVSFTATPKAFSTWEIYEFGADVLPDLELGVAIGTSDTVDLGLRLHFPLGTPTPIFDAKVALLRSPMLDVAVAGSLSTEGYTPYGNATLLVGLTLGGSNHQLMLSPQVWLYAPFNTLAARVGGSTALVLQLTPRFALKPEIGVAYGFGWPHPPYIGSAWFYAWNVQAGVGLLFTTDRP